MVVIFLLLLCSSSILLVSISPFPPTTYACHCTGLASKLHYSAPKEFSTVNYIKTSGLWKLVSQFNYSVVNSHTYYINTKQLTHHQTNILRRTVQMFPMFTFFAVWHFVIAVLYPHCQAAIKIRDYFAIPVKFASWNQRIHSTCTT